MARFAFRLPDIGEGIAEAEIVAWHVKVGDAVAEDQRLADLMTDKVTVEMESPVSGTVLELAGEVGDQVAIGAALVVIETDMATADMEPSAAAAAVAPITEIKSDPALGPEVAPKGGRHRGEESGKGEASSLAEPDLSLPLPTFACPSRRVFAAPTVRARAAALGIDLAGVKAASDRVRHADLDAFITYNAGKGFRPAGSARPDEHVKVMGMRRRVAENMAASKRHIPHFTYVEEIDVTKLEELRADLNAMHGAERRLSVLPFLIVALCRAIPDYPMINARYDDELGVVIRHGRVHLGMATQTDAGLMVPVIRDAQDRNIWQLAREIARLAESARTGRARSEELSGSTLTVTSLGPLGGIASAPVINRPEVAIIGPNKIVERPIFAKDSSSGDVIVRAKLMNLSISCDHRVVDGWDAASFVTAVKALIETPALLFMEPDDE